eukprot:SAG22_NODE_14111_length_384_cov_0.726316_1_plen_66_part_00
MTLAGKQYDSVTPEFCAAKSNAFNETDTFTSKGGFPAASAVLDKGVRLQVVRSTVCLVAAEPARR